MGFSKTEINLRRLLNAAPRQQSQAKLMHYIATSRELLEQLVAETTPEGLPRVSKAVVNDYSEKIEALTAKLAAPQDRNSGKMIGTAREINGLYYYDGTDSANKTAHGLDMPESSSVVDKAGDVQLSPKTVEPVHVTSRILRRRVVSHQKVEDVNHENTEPDPSLPVKLDAEAQKHIEKHRKLQEDLTDEMVGLARQLKASSLLMNQSLQDTEKILDSTEKAVEHSLASTGHANSRAMEIYSQTMKTTCFTWLIIFFMTCIFIMVVLLIRVT